MTILVGLLILLIWPVAPVILTANNHPKIRVRRYIETLGFILLVGPPALGLILIFAALVGSVALDVLK